MCYLNAVQKLKEYLLSFLNMFYFFVDIVRLEALRIEEQN